MNFNQLKLNHRCEGKKLKQLPIRRRSQSRVGKHLQVGRNQSIFEPYFQMKSVAAVLCRLCGKTAALLRTKTGNDQNGDPELFRDEASRCSRISPFHKTMISSQNRTSAEHPGSDQSWRKPEDGPEETLHNSTLQRTMEENSRCEQHKSCSCSHWVYLKDPFTLTTESIKTTRDGAFSRENIRWLQTAEMFCLLRCESRIFRKCLNCQKSGRVVTRLKERKWERKKEWEEEGNKKRKKGRPRERWVWKWKNDWERRGVKVPIMNHNIPGSTPAGDLCCMSLAIFLFSFPVIFPLSTQIKAEKYQEVFFKKNRRGSRPLLVFKGLISQSGC